LPQRPECARGLDRECAAALHARRFLHDNPATLNAANQPIPLVSRFWHLPLQKAARARRTRAVAEPLLLPAAVGAALQAQADPELAIDTAVSFEPVVDLPVHVDVRG